MYVTPLHDVPLSGGENGENEGGRITIMQRQLYKLWLIGDTSNINQTTLRYNRHSVHKSVELIGGPRKMHNSVPSKAIDVCIHIRTIHSNIKSQPKARLILLLEGETVSEEIEEMNAAQHAVQPLPFLCCIHVMHGTLIGQPKMLL